MISYWWQFEFTPKALANFSPGFALKPWGSRCMFVFVATLKELRRASVISAQPFQGLRLL